MAEPSSMARVSPGMYLLITAASGGVGSFAVQQLAKLGNLQVTATCGCSERGSGEEVGRRRGAGLQNSGRQELEQPIGEEVRTIW
ncbi:hypothetical protein BHE74_00032275 [Ensete ventricosum]|nr:hypothetical protein BHE74_00032275 [Ensete ventricosum]